MMFQITLIPLALINCSLILVCTSQFITDLIIALGVGVLDLTIVNCCEERFSSIQ